MIYLDHNTLPGAVIYDTEIRARSGLVIGITDWSTVELRDDSDGAEIAAAVLAGLRERRNALLTACDWTQLPGAPLTDAQQAAWQTYRQALRDLPEAGSLVLGGTVWPVAPADS